MFRRLQAAIGTGKKNSNHGACHVLSAHRVFRRRRCRDDRIQPAGTAQCHERRHAHRVRQCARNRLPRQGDQGPGADRARQRLLRRRRYQRNEAPARSAAGRSRIQRMEPSAGRAPRAVVPAGPAETDDCRRQRRRGGPRCGHRAWPATSSWQRNDRNSPGPTSSEA